MEKEFTESDKVLTVSEKEPSKEYRIGELPRNDFKLFVIRLVYCGCLVVPTMLMFFFGAWGILSILGLFFIPWHSLLNWYAND